MKKRVLALLLALAIAAGLTACGAPSSENSTSEEAAVFTPQLDAEEEATVNIVGVMENFESLEAVISDFEEIYPNCQVLYTQLDSDMLGARLASDSTVGIFMLDSSRYQSYPALSEYCADLSQEDINLSAVREAALSSNTVDGKLFGLPLAQDTSGLIVNVSLLEDAGLSVPTNYSELLEACQTLKEKGYTPFQAFDSYEDYSYLDRMLFRNMFYSFLTQALDDGNDLSLLFAGESGSAAFLQPVFEKFMELIDGGYIDPEVNALYTDTYNAAILQFFEGDAPFLVATTETYSGTKKRETKSEAYQADPFEYKFICAPLADDGAYTYMENWLSFCLNDQCENKEWALEFLRFLATEEELNQLASVKGLISVAKNSDDERFAEIYPEDEALLAYENYAFPNGIDATLSKVLLELGAGTISIDDATGEFERLLQEGNTSGA